MVVYPSMLLQGRSLQGTVAPPPQFSEFSKIPGETFCIVDKICSPLPPDEIPTGMYYAVHLTVEIMVKFI